MLHSIEREVITRLIQAGLDKGYTFSVDDGGDELAIERETRLPLLMDYLCNTDEDRLYFHNSEGKVLGWFLLIYGNEPHYVIADHSGSKETSRLFEEVQDLIDDYDARY